MLVFFLIALVIYAISRPDFIPLERILFFLTNSPSWIIKSSPFKVKTYAFFTLSNLLIFSIDGSNVFKIFSKTFISITSLLFFKKLEPCSGYVNNHPDTFSNSLKVSI